MEKKTDPKISKPHYYGKVAGVHVFHATGDGHEKLVGIHIENPDDEKLNQATEEARTKGMKSVIIHGTPPEAFRTRINEDLGAHKPGRLMKSEVAPVRLSKSEEFEWDYAYPVQSDLEKAEKPSDLTEHHGKKVKVYFNLHKKVWSVQHEGKVIGHCKQVAIDNPKFKVSESGRQRVIKEKRKNVHAFVEGNLNTKHADFSPEGKKRVSYNPYKAGHFVESGTENPVHSASQVTMHVEEKHGENGVSRIPHVHAKDASDLKKTFLQNDKQTRSDIMAHTNSLQATSPSLIEWGAKKLSSLPKDAVESVELDNRIIKVRKHDADQYSGWIETKDGNIAHQFERITLPELMTQLQSKLELYGREGEAVKDNDESPDLKGVQERLLSLKNRLQSLLEDAGLDHNIAEQEAEEVVQEVKEKKEEPKKPKVDAPLKVSEEDEPKPDANGEIKMEIPTKELIPGMVNPEKVCPACERNVDRCVCFMGMEKPRLEVDMKAGKVTILFKAVTWDAESREAFADDFKRRAGRLLNKKFS